MIYSQTQYQAKQYIEGGISTAKTNTPNARSKMNGWCVSGTKTSDTRPERVDPPILSPESAGVQILLIHRHLIRHYFEKFQTGTDRKWW